MYNMRINLRKYYNKTITVYAIFQTYGRGKYYTKTDSNGIRTTVHPEPTFCIKDISKNLIKPLCSHAWISGRKDSKILKQLKIKRGDLIKITATVIRYDNKENYTFDGVENVFKINNPIVIFYYRIYTKIVNKLFS